MITGNALNQVHDLRAGLFALHRGHKPDNKIQIKELSVASSSTITAGVIIERDLLLVVLGDLPSRRARSRSLVDIRPLSLIFALGDGCEQFTTFVQLIEIGPLHFIFEFGNGGE
jgi:hypothetical protein